MMSRAEEPIIGNRYSEKEAQEVRDKAEKKLQEVRRVRKEIEAGKSKKGMNWLQQHAQKVEEPSEAKAAAKDEKEAEEKAEPIGEVKR